MKRISFLLLAALALLLGAILVGISSPKDALAADIPTPTVTLTPQVIIEPTLTPIIELTPTPSSLAIPSDISTPKIEAFIRAPSGTVARPYVILSGYQSYPNDDQPVSISGTVVDKAFTCPTSPCALEYPESSYITFRAQNAQGAKSEDVQANILVTKVADGYSVTILSLSKFAIFSDACAVIWKNTEVNPPSWAKFPQDPGELDTEKTLYYLAARLLKAGVVDAQDCPGGGWDNNTPNPCGLAKVKDQMIAWQNRFDFNIWLVGRDQHVPPILLKTLLEIESQFWPTSQRLFLDELGLGQINQLGIDVLLRTNPGLYQQVCSTSLYKCDKPYESLDGIDRSLIRGALVQSLDAGCSTCAYGLDLNRASQSIGLIGKVLYANCVQAQSILNYYKVNASYEDSWKFTLVSYHSGFGCLQSAVDKVAVKGELIEWNTVAENLDCPGASDYIDRFWTSLLTFNQFVKKPGELPLVQLQIPAPLPTQARPTSTARILVKVFFDKNGDGIQQPDEALDNVQVNITLENGATFTQITQNGMAIFDLTGISVGVRGTISLPGLYRSASIQIPDSGDMPITFIFTKPILPTQSP